MVYEIIEEFLSLFISKIARKIGAAVRWIWFGQKYSFDQLRESKWSLRIGIVTLCLIFASTIMVLS
ncbi:hypothetical protein [Flavobacterium sp.]|jgi:hypothetical protein|uniref:hypothetical protein n=1 Tax=Flavobacterium sp. TaxID=239 RepID=UPI0037C106BF